jgi:ferredoxin-NADP reductase
MTSPASGNKTATTIEATHGSNSDTRVTDPTPVKPPTPSPWSQATVVAVRRETATAKTFRLRLSHPSLHLAGQHYIIRLTAPDGYAASRSYSVASAPDGTPEIEITVERLPDGEVSSFLHDEVVAGDALEVRGPIGGWFVWSGQSPALLIAGGSGVVPLMAMLRLARSTGASDLVRLVISVRNSADLYYASELPGPETTIIYTRQSNPTDIRPPGHLTVTDLPTVPADATAYICGSSPFADAASDLTIAIGIPTQRIRIERFGPTG